MTIVIEMIPAGRIYPSSAGRQSRDKGVKVDV